MRSAPDPVTPVRVAPPGVLARPPPTPATLSVNVSVMLTVGSNCQRGGGPSASAAGAAPTACCAGAEPAAPCAGAGAAAPCGGAGPGVAYASVAPEKHSAGRHAAS